MMHTRHLRGWLLHTPNYVLMPFDGPTLTTVHDLSWLSYPEAHPVERVRFLDRHLPRSLERASMVLTDSEFIAAEIASRFALSRAKIRVVPLGVDASYRPRGSRTRARARKAQFAGGQLSSRRRDTRTAQESRATRAAYGALPAALQSRHPLVIVGARGWLSSDLERAVAPLESAGKARRLGYVDERELPLIYAGAHAFAFPSLYEGFGLPVLEAMASGVPVLTSNVSSLPEIAGDAALTVDPRDDAAMAAGLERLLEDSSWRTTASAHGIARASEFPWSRCVDSTVDAYRAVSHT